MGAFDRTQLPLHVQPSTTLSVSMLRVFSPLPRDFFLPIWISCSYLASSAAAASSASNRVSWVCVRTAISFA